MIEARGITKRYPGVTALDGVDFSVRRGEVVGLIGENGAGKSTLIKILGGLTRPDAGEVLIDGQPVHLANAAEATRCGIGVIHQELNNLDNLDVAGNVFLGREPRKLGFLIDRPTMLERTAVFLRQLGLDIDPSTPLQSLSIAQQQMVEIAKALSLDAKILIMDEPTSSLTAGETERLMQVVQELRERNVGVVYVSHRLAEVKLLADRVVGLRDGKNAGGLAQSEITPEAMVRLMVGRDIERGEIRKFRERTPKLVVTDLRTRRYPGHPITFSIGEGEIVGFAGLVGAGRTEVARAIYGVDGRLAGRVLLDGEEIPAHSPAAAIARGLYLAPEDRRKEGLITSMAVRENVTLPDLARYAPGMLIDRSRETAVAGKMREQLRIKAPTVETEVRGLSGGNQQKVVLAKWLSMQPKCLIFDEPTRGIDVGARAEIYGLMEALADQGVAIIMISSDMEEVLRMSDRIVVMHEGRLAGEMPRETADEETVMRLAVGRG